MKNTSTYWNNRYLFHQTGWNIGYPSTPIKAYIDQLEDISISILVPGAGNGYEVQYLFQQGYHNVFMLDIAPKPLQDFANRNPDFPKEQIINKDFFIHEGKYDLILEQTFFCAIPPQMRQQYAHKMYNLLNPKGTLTGLWFSFPLTEQGPPFGGSLEEYESLFKNYFEIKTFSTSYNSIPSRQGNELFGILQRK